MLRTVFTYHPLGAETSAWKGVTGAGQEMKLTPTLQPLEPVKEHLLILDGLNGRPHPASGHNRSACLWLSGASRGKADAWGAETDVTVDQVLAPRLSDGARQKSLELSCNKVGSLMHALFLSWRAPGVPLGAETDPRDVFARMFGDAREDRNRKSILDVVAEDARTLKAKLGRADQGRLEEYLESVRSLERQMAVFAQGASKRPAPPLALPEQPPPNLRAYVRLMLDLIVVAFQTDFTRVITCALGDETEGTAGTTYARTLNDFGIDKSQFAGQVPAKYLGYGHHSCTHDPKPTLAMIQAMDRWYVEQLAYLLQKLASIREGDGSLLDHSIVVYGSTNNGGNGHGWPGHGLKDVACLLAGHARLRAPAGRLPRTGRQIAYYGKDRKDSNSGVPLANLWLTLLHLAGLERKEFGLSTGTLAGLG